MNAMSAFRHTLTHSRGAVTLIGVFIIAFSLFITTPCPVQKQSTSSTLLAQASSRVVINRESDFKEQGYSGNGSKANPYLIEGLTFTNVTAPCIVIGNVTAFVEIRHCNFEYTEMAEPYAYSHWPRNVDVWLNEVKDVEIIDCSFVSNGDIYHIESQYSDALVIENCVINGGTLGVESHVKSVQIMNNAIWADWALTVSDASDCLLYNNNITTQDYTDTWLGYNIDSTNITANHVVGNVELDLHTINATIDGNVVTGMFSLSLWVATQMLSVTHNRFGSGGFAYGGPPESAEIADNYVHGLPIVVLKNQNQKSVDLSQMAQLIAFGCRNLKISGTANNVSAAVILDDCSDSRISHISLSDCDTGIWIEGSKNLSITSFSISTRDQGMYIDFSKNITLMDGAFLGCSIGADIETTQGVIITSCRFINDKVGVEMISTPYSIIYNNTFDCTYRNAGVLSVAPNTIQWDYNGTGNSWNDYYWSGAYLVGFDTDGMTVADHHPVALNPARAYLIMAGSLTIIASLVILFGLGPYALLRGAGEHKLRPKRYNSYLLISAVVLAVFVPTLAFSRSGSYGDTLWCISSSLYSIWTDSGFIYVNGPALLSYGSYLNSPQLQSPALSTGLSLLSVVAIIAAWKQAVAGKRYILPLLLALLLLTFGAWGLVVPMGIWGLSSNILQIPLPIGIVAIYLLFRKAKPIDIPPPEIRKATKEIKVVCPECRAVYYYRFDAVVDGSVICHNCNKSIAIQDLPSNV